MQFADYLAREWRPALGCTEPASIAYAAAVAAVQARGAIEHVRLVCDPRMYKNCYAVGIPHSGRRFGIRWAVAIGAQLEDPALRLESFRLVTPPMIESAARLLGEERVSVEVSDHGHLRVEVAVARAGGTGRAVIEHDHTNLTLLERNGRALPVGAVDGVPGSPPADPRAGLCAMSFEELVPFARSITPEDRIALRHGVELNLAIAQHGLSLLPESFRPASYASPQERAGRLVCAGVHARMSGEDFVVMSLAGSGNKGITCAVPIAVEGAALGLPQERVDEALALAALFTSVTTHHLGTLAAVCGCSNAAGVGLAAGLVLLHGGDAAAISLAVSNMVGNVAGMICDGAKIGCALKTTTAVDAAWRAASLALSGVGIPYTDGIVGRDGRSSLAHLGRIATQGMGATDDEILRIMREKL